MQILGGYILKAVKNLEEKEEVKHFDIADKGQELLKIRVIATEQKRSVS